MLGPPKSRCLDQPIAVSLEELVPSGNFYRHLKTKLDVSFVREWTRDLYAERGRPSIDPVVFFKTQPRHRPSWNQAHYARSCVPPRRAAGSFATPPTRRHHRS